MHPSSRLKRLLIQLSLHFYSGCKEGQRRTYCFAIVIAFVAVISFLPFFITLLFSVSYDNNNRRHTKSYSEENFANPYQINFHN